MSSTLGTLLRQLEPNWSISLFERLDRPGLESSGPFNNAGTGHSALCELNYTPADEQGLISPTKAIGINEQFQVTRQFWSHLVSTGKIGDPKSFIHPVPHMSFVWGDSLSQFLRGRYEALKPQPLFKNMEFSQDHDTLADWVPLVMNDRSPDDAIAATRATEGTDVDFGSLSNQMTSYMESSGVDLNYNHDVTDLRRDTDGRWLVAVKDNVTGRKFTVRAKYVFIGAGGHALPLLQRSGIEEGKGFGGFPVSGQFLYCTDDKLVEQHNAKVYGQAAVGAPPMSVPHLDTRYVDGKRSMLFGPYAGFSTKYLKSGSFLDLPTSIRPSNIIPMLASGKDNLGLVKFLVSEVFKSREAKNDALRDYLPDADGDQWEMVTAGQRVQVIKKDKKKGGVLQFGTEVVASADGSLSALLGASPGASTAVPIMIGMLQRCFPERVNAWEPLLKDMIPSHGVKLNENESLADEVMAETAKVLKLS